MQIVCQKNVAHQIILVINKKNVKKFDMQLKKVPKTDKFLESIIVLKSYLHINFKMKPQGTCDNLNF